jgi:hypothetical protein
MKPVKQRLAGGDFSAATAHNIGDCFKCCIASVLEREYEEVSHFVQLEYQIGYYYLDLLNKWLKKQGYCFQANGGSPHRAFMAKNDVAWNSKGERLTSSGITHPGYWIAYVKSKRYIDKTHSVVMHEDKMAFDPSDLFGTPEYDAKPYEFTGYLVQFLVTEPHRAPRIV